MSEWNSPRFNHHSCCHRSSLLLPHGDSCQSPHRARPMVGTQCGLVLLYSGWISRILDRSLSWSSLSGGVRVLLYHSNQHSHRGDHLLAQVNSCLLLPSHRAWWPEVWLLQKSCITKCWPSWSCDTWLWEIHHHLLRWGLQYQYGRSHGS